MMTLQKALETVSVTQNLSQMKTVLEKECPTIMKALRLVDESYRAARQPKGYNLIKVKNKKLGFVYYVRYWHNGKMLPSKWCTHTNIPEKASEYAAANRQAHISRYTGQSGTEILRFFEKFYETTNPIYQNEYKKENELTEQNRKRHLSTITKKFIPFLKERNITSYDQIDVPFLDGFQDALLARGMKSNTVNMDMVPVSKILKYLMRKGIIKTNPYLSLARVSKKPGEQKTHGCYELDKLKGVFCKDWTDSKARLLNLTAYTTNMRNCEIGNFCKDDIKELSGCYFINIKQSKTESGVRLVPLHAEVYRQIMAYAHDLDSTTPVFGKTSTQYFSKAAGELGKMMNVSEEYLKKHYITFYSGRHAWKTMMSAEGLGEDIEEIWMGHKVSGDVAKLYNHRDKQGQGRMVKKAREVYKILDKIVFKAKG